jgi:hypothetical protein
MPRNSAAPALPVPSRVWPDDEPALVSTGPGLTRSQMSGPAPRVPRQVTGGGPSSPPYGDWTRPSRSPDAAVTPPAADTQHPSAPVGQLRLRDTPATTAIPERTTAVRRERSGEGVDDDESVAVTPGASRGPGTGPVGGRAALRAERQAAEVARKKAAKRSGGSTVAVRDADEPRRKSRRVTKGLLAMAVVALGVLGVYSFTSPRTAETAAQTPTITDSAPTDAPVNSALPALPSTPVDVAPTPAAPVRVPITVLNATDINGLAADIAATFGGAGWEAPAVGTYKAGDVAASTVFFTEGDENQRQAAVQLVDQFPQLQGPAPRFFELPPGVAAPGLVVVLTGDWRP